MRRLPAALLSVLLAAPAAAQTGGVVFQTKAAGPWVGEISAQPPCNDGVPMLFLATDGTSSTDCATGDGTTEGLCLCLDGTWSAVGAGGGDVSSVFARTGAVVAEAGDYDAALIDYTPADGTDWTDPDPTTLEQAGDDLAARVTDDEAALSSHAGNADAHHARDHAAAHALGGADPLTVTTLASGCTDAEVLGGTAVGTGVECQAAGGGGVPGGADTQVQYNSSGAFAGDEDFTFASDVLRLGAVNAATRLRLPQSNDRFNPTIVFGDGDSGWNETADDTFALVIATFNVWNFTSGEIYGRFGNSGPYMRSVTTSATVPGFAPNGADSNTGIGWAASDDGRLIAGSVSSLGWTATETTLFVEQVNAAYARTCTDSGDGNPGTLIASVSGASYLELTGSDADGCAVTLSETGATEGQRIEAVVVATAGGVLNYADTPGVQETGAGCSLSLYGTATFRYIGDRHVLVACTPAN